MDQTPEPQSVQTLRKLVVALLVVMILAVITITTLFVMRFGATPADRLGVEFLAVKNDDVIEVYDAETGTLLQTITPVESD